MAAPDNRKLDDLRRGVRAPYGVKARLEIAGVTESGRGWPVQTVDAGELGIRVRSSRQLPRVAAQLRLTAPGGERLSVKGWVIYSQQVGVDLWESGVEFDAPQPLLSAIRIDAATYGR